MAENSPKTGSIHVRPSADVIRYLDDLAHIGIHGKTPSEVAKTLIGNEIERLIREGMLQLRKNG